MLTLDGRPIGQRGIDVDLLHQRDLHPLLLVTFWTLCLALCGSLWLMGRPNAAVGETAKDRRARCAFCAMCLFVTLLFIGVPHLGTGMASLFAAS